MTWQKILRNFIAASAFFAAGFSIWWVQPEPYYWEVIFNLLIGCFGFLFQFRVAAPIFATFIYRTSGNRFPMIDVEKDAVLVRLVERYFVVKLKS